MELYQNILIVIYKKNGHIINTPGTNDDCQHFVFPVGGENYRVDMHDFAKIEKQSYFDKWETANDIEMLKIYSKDLKELPDV